MRRELEMFDGMPPGVYRSTADDLRTRATDANGDEHSSAPEA